jgi:hypothetical protein
MNLELRVKHRPKNKQLHNAILKGVATAIITETQKAFEARSQSIDYPNANPWPLNSSEWTIRKLNANQSSLIGIQSGSLERAVYSLTYEISSNQVIIKLDNEHASEFDKKHPIFVVPDNDTMQEYIALAIQESISGS